MKLIKNNKGYNVIEVLVVAAVISLLVILAGNISSKFGTRRSVDNMAHKLTSYLNLVKIQANRNGVEYHAVFNFDDSVSKMSIKTERGDSNRNSTTFNEISNEIVKMNLDYEIIPSASDVTFTFSPTSSASFDNGQTITIRPKVDSDIIKCAVIGVTNFGRIRTVMGRWDFNTSTCRHIHDKQET